MDARGTYERSKQAVTLYAEWPLRIVFASIFMYHGLAKITGDMGAFADGVGLSLGLAWLVAIMEVAAGLFVFIGGFSFPYHTVFTRLGATAAIPVMIGAIAKMHWPRWSFTPADGFPLGGMEFQVTLILVSLYFLASTGRIREHAPPKPMPKDADGDTRARVWMRNLPGGAHWFLRIAVAAVFIFHGFTKFGTLDDFAAMMGLTVAGSFVVALAECTAGILILAGGAQTDYADGASRLGGLLILPVMLGAIIKVHGGRWSFTPADGFPMGGAEFQTLLLMIGLFFVLRGRPAYGPIAHPRATGA